MYAQLIRTQKGQNSLEDITWSEFGERSIQAELKRSIQQLFHKCALDMRRYVASEARNEWNNCFIKTPTKYREFFPTLFVQTADLQLVFILSRRVQLPYLESMV